MNFYRNGNYVVCLMGDGTKIRRTDSSSFIPEFAENVDVLITRKCSMSCPFCYEGCNPRGKHADLLSYTGLLDSLHPWTEIAINGNDLDHPQLLDFLKELKKRKVCPNITVHQEQFMKNFDYLKELEDLKLVHGVGVSWSGYDKEFLERASSFPNLVIHTINGILSRTDIENMKPYGLKILILGYKQKGRGIDFLSDNAREITERQKWLESNIENIIKDGYFKVVSFDNLAISQLGVDKLIGTTEFYMGDDGDYTFYIDLVNGMFAKNSVTKEKYPIENLTIDEMFNKIKNKKI